MKNLLFLFAFMAFAFSARAEETAPVAETPAPAAPAQPVPAPAPVAKEPEEDNKPGALTRRLKAVAATLTGDHASLSDVADRDATIARLTAENTAHVATIAGLKGQLESQAKEAEDYLKGVYHGQIDPVKNPPKSAAQKTLVDAVSNGTAAAIAKVGIPVEDLVNGQKPDAPDVKLEGLARATHYFNTITKGSASLSN